MLPALAGCTGAEPLLVVDGVDQFPKRDLTTGCAAGWPAATAPAEMLLKPEKDDGALVALLVVRPNADVIPVAETVEAVEVEETEEGCGKIGLKSWIPGLVSEEAAADEVVVAAAKMGLKPAVRRGFVVLAG